MADGTACQPGQSLELGTKPAKPKRQLGLYDEGEPDPHKATPTGKQTGICTTEGMWNCIGGSSFQQCASGLWSTPQSMALGTTCQPGQSPDLQAVTVAKPKRAIRFSGEHLRMREAF
jgi:hypothetical protein